MSDWTIITPTVDDASALAAFAQATFAVTFDYCYYPPDDIATFFATSMSGARYADRIADPAYRVRMARDEAGAIAGFITIGPNDLPLPDGEPDASDTRELHQLYCGPAAQGTGLAKQLMAELDADAADYAPKAIYLSVFSLNHKAQRFYARYGFAELCPTIFMVGNTADDDRIWKRAL